MEYEKSERADTEYGEGEVHIREDFRGVMHYAVFDGKEQVSEEMGPLNETEIIWFRKGYISAKENLEE